MPHRTELLGTGGFVIAQGLATTIPIWKIESILRLELWFMTLCFSCQKWAQPKVPLTTHCWGGFTVKIFFISQLAVKSQIVLKHHHYPQNSAALLPNTLAKPAPVRTGGGGQGGNSGDVTNGFCSPSLSVLHTTGPRRNKWEARGHPEWFICSSLLLLAFSTSNPTTEANMMMN